VLNGGKERTELKKLKQVWSTSTYSGEVPEEMCWKVGIWIHDDVRHNSIHGSWKHTCPPSVTFVWSSRWWWKGMGTPMISQYGKVKLVPGYRMNEWVLIATCTQLVWSTRIGRNMPIWILCLILESGPGADLPLEVTGPWFRVIGTCSPRSSAYRPFACQLAVSTSRFPEHTPLTVYRAVTQVPPPLCS
jgi:hypothetical protein